MHNDELQLVWKVPHNPPRMLQTDKLPDDQLSQRCSHMFMISQSSTFDQQRLAATYLLISYRSSKEVVSFPHTASQSWPNLC